MERDLLGRLVHSRLNLPVAIAMAFQIEEDLRQAARKVPNLVRREVKHANIPVNGGEKVMATDLAQNVRCTPA